MRLLRLRYRQNIDHKLLHLALNSHQSTLQNLRVFFSSLGCNSVMLDSANDFKYSCAALRSSSAFFLSSSSAALTPVDGLDCFVDATPSPMQPLPFQLLSFHLLCQ